MPRQISEWEFDIQVVDETTGNAISGQIVEAWDKDYAKNKNGNDLLWVSTTDKNGKCRGKFGKDRFQDITQRHLAKRRPDVYFIVKDSVGNVLLDTEVKTSLRADLYAYVLRVNSEIESQFSPQKAAKYEWTILGELAQINAGQRYVVECYDKDTYNQYGADDWLFTVTTDSRGKFEQTFFDWDFRFKVGEKEKEPDTYFVVKDLKGNILYITEVFADLNSDHVFYLKIDLKSLSATMVSVPMSKTRVKWAARVKNPKIIKFPVAYNSLTKFSAKSYISLVNPLLTPVKYPYYGNRSPFFSYVRVPVRNAWQFDVNIVNSKTGKPLIGARVEAWDKDFSKTKSDNDLLWIDTTDRNGHCAGYCTNNDFQDLSIGHEDEKKPDVYFVVKDRKGNFLHSSKVYANLRADLHKFTLKVDPTPKTVKPIQSKTAPYWNIQGDIISVLGTGPFVVECYDKDYSEEYGPEHLLFKETVLANGRFQQTLYEGQFGYEQGMKEREPDIFFVVRDLRGQEIYTSKVFSDLERSEKGEAYRFLIDLIRGQTSVKTSQIPIGGSAASPGSGPLINQVPSIKISQPSGRLIQGESIRIDYLAFDAESNNIYIEAAYSLDGGSTFQQATEAAHPASEGTSNLSTSPAGENHVFIWKAKDDLPAIPTQDVIFRLQPFDPKAGGSDSTQPFTVGPIVAAGASVEAKILSPQPNTTQGAVVEIKYELKSGNSDRMRIAASYSKDGGVTFNTASEAFGFGSEGLDNLSSSPTGKVHSFFWNAGSDMPSLPANTKVIFQIESFGTGIGGVDTVGPLEIDFGNLPTMVDVYFPPAGSKQGSPVAIEYVLTDRDNDMARIEAFYSIDNGESFFTASPANGGDGTDNLQASSYGEVKTFMWDAARDIQGSTQDDVIFKIQAFDNNAGGIDYSDIFDVTMPIAPTVNLIGPNSGVWGVPLPINYILSHPGGNQLLSVEIEYSLDRGQTYRSATEAANLGSEGLTDLPSSTNGVRHFFAWDVLNDIPSLNIDVQKGVLVRVRAYKGSEMGEAISERFDIDAAYVGVPENNIAPGSTPNRTSIHVFDPVDHTGIHVATRFLLKHPDNLKVNVRVEFSVNGGEYRPATAARNSDQTTNLAAPEFSAYYKYVWNAQDDLAKLGLTSGTAKLRFTPYMGGYDDLGVETKPFNVTIEETEELKKVPPKTQYNNLTLSIIEGDNQEIIPGLVAHENLTVELRDANGEAVQDARITFSAGPNSQVPVTFETHPRYLTSTDYYGRAGIRVRPKEGVEGTINIVARVVGMPGVSAVFNLTSRIPKIVPAKSNPKPPFEYGKVYQFYFYLDSGLDPTKANFSNDLFDPVEFKITTHNAEADEKIIHLPGPRASYNGFYVGITPSYLGGVPSTGGTSVAPPVKAFDLKIEVLNVPGVLLFSVGVEAQGDLNNGAISGDLRQEFMKKGISLSNNASVSVETDASWLITSDDKVYIVRRQGGKLNIHASVKPYEQKFSIQTDNNAKRLQGVRVLNNGFGPADYVYQDKRLHLEVVSGHDPSDPGKKLPQTAYPGLTLSTPFQVKVVDEVGKEYTESTKYAGTIATSGPCDQIKVSREPLKISWSAAGGVLSKSAGEGTKSNLQLGVNEPVYFTPTSAGPWSVTAGANHVYVYDGQPEKFPYIIKRNVMKAGVVIDTVADLHCACKAGFDANLGRTFFIHSPEKIGFEDINKASALTPGPLLGQVKAGMKSRILVKSLSPSVASSTPKEIELQSIRIDGSDVPAYTGTSQKFNQKIILKKDLQDDSILRSGEILFLQNEEKTSSGIPMAFLPLSRIKAEVASLRFSVKTAGLKRQRLRFDAGSLDGDTEFPYESPVGTSPTGGALGSVILHNGEFVIDNCDLSFPSRAREVAVCRTYRSQAQSLLDTHDKTEAVEPLGPGWFLDAGAHLEVSHKHLRFWSGDGVYYDYMFDRPGKGQFIFITRNNTISTDQSAYEIRDRNRNYMHFNIDGTLRFYIDRFGNKYEYEYDEKAQLVKIKDCMQPDHRNFTISYHEYSDDNAKNLWVDKIKEIIDFEGRKITYEYYEKDEKRNGVEVGGPGFLKKVNFPECETVFEGGSKQQDHRSYELFEYEKDNRLGWRLKTVYVEDSKGAEQKLLTNYYDAKGRIVRQEEGEGEYTITPKASGKVDYEIHYKDKNGNTWKFSYPNSPYWDFTAPKEVTDPESFKTEMRHNNHGHLTYIKPPKGGTIDYVYDEDSQYSRARADLLGVIETSEQGKKRITTYTYSGRHHFLLTTVGPEGNLPGVDPRLYIFVNNYDHQRSSDGEGAGNVVDSFGPRSLNIVYKPVANNQRQPVWIEDEQQNDYTYNSFGQITSHIDERGVKTEYTYYSAGNPTGGSIGPVGGGFLAQVKYDTEATAKRNLHLPGSDASPQTTEINYVYNNLGYVTETFDEDGIRTVYTLNKLGDVIKEEQGIGVKGLNITSTIDIGPNGEVVKTEVTQPGNGIEKIEKENMYDQYGRLVERISKINGSNEATIAYKYDKGDRLKTITDSQTGIETTREYNTRDLETKTTVKSGSLTLTTDKAYNENGVLKEITAPTGDKTVFTQNDFGETVKTTDKSTGISSESILNDAGVPVVELDSESGGGVGAAQETVFDEYFRVRRVHNLRFRKATGSTSSGRRFRKIPENLGLQDSTYLSSLGEILPDGDFGPNDGRTTVDMAWNIGGNLVQVKDDELGQYMLRQDGLGRQLEFDDRSGTRINTVYDDNNNTREVSYTAESDNPQFSETPHTFKLTSQYNELGVPVSDTDERNRTASYETDDAGKITRVTNPENAEVILKYDDLGNIEESEMEVKVSGTHSSDELNKLKQSISLYNSSAKIRDRAKFDEIGRLISVKDNADNEYKYIYENNQLKKIIYPGPNGEEVFLYDTSGRLKTHTDPGGQVTTYSYEKGRLSGIKTGTVETVFKYDGIGNIKEVVDNNDPEKSIKYEYDSLGNITKEILIVDGQPQSTEYEYDGAGRLTKTIYSANDFVENVYDNKTGRLKEVKDQDGTITSYSYFGDAIKQESTNGINTIYKYNNGQLSEKKVTGLVSGDIVTSYTFDVMDRLISETETINGQQTIRKYVYDTAGRVLKEELKIPSVPLPLVTRYYYDGDGIVLREERDEYDVDTGKIERVLIERKRDDRGLITSSEEISRKPLSLPLPRPGYIT